MTALTEIQYHLDQIKQGNCKIQPGEPFRLNDAATIGDGAWQGDLGIEIVAELPTDYVAAEKGMLQLVPGNTVGARHVLADGQTIRGLRVPANWGQQYEGLQGPGFHCKKETTIEHPVHGNIVIAKGHTILCRYQRQYDEELKRERRAID